MNAHMRSGAPVVSLIAYTGMGKPIPVIPAWGDVLVEYATWLRAVGRPQTTIKLRSYQLRRFAATMGLDPWAATTDDLVTYLGMHEWSGDTKRSTRAGLRGFYAWARSTGRIDDDPSLGLGQVRGRIGTPRPAPELAVRGALSGPDARIRLMVALAAQAGLRCREIALVRSSDVRRDLLGFSLLVHGKGDKERVVPIPDRLAYDIADIDGWAFPGQVDGHLSPAYVSKLVSEALPEGITAHMLRHRYASRAYAAERDIRAVQELLGHSSVATTQIYTAVDSDALRRAARNAA